MVKILRRVKRLEEEILPAPEEPREMMTIHFVGAGRKVVSTLEFQVGHVRPPKRGCVERNPSESLMETWARSLEITCAELRSLLAQGVDPILRFLEQT